MNAPDLTSRQSLADYMTALGERARAASGAMAAAPTAAKDNALRAIAAAIRADAKAIAAANRRDVERARADGLEPALVDRLTLTDAAIEQMAAGLEQIVAAARSDRRDHRACRAVPTGIQVGRMRVPLGVIGIIYECAAQRDGRRRRPVPQERQRDHPARRLRSD